MSGFDLIKLHIFSLAILFCYERERESLIRPTGLDWTRLVVVVVVAAVLGSLISIHVFVVESISWSVNDSYAGRADGWMDIGGVGLRFRKVVL